MDPIELLNLIIEEFGNLGVDFAAGDETADERIARLSAELSSGDRTFVDIVGSLLGQDVFTDLEVEGKDSDDADRIAQELLDGREIADLIGSLDRLTDQDLIAGEEDNPIPGGATLIRITDPTGTDAAVRYVVAYDINGLNITYDIGTLDDFLGLFPSGESGFDTTRTLTQSQFDDEGFIEVGAVDEILGQTESLTSQFERELTALGNEGLADWMANDPTALTLIATAASEDWSSTRLWNELSETQGFADRFGAFDSYAVAGETVEATIGRLIAEEERVTAALIQYRPAGFEITTDYLQDVLALGWTGSEVSAVLEAEELIRNNPESLNQLNAILIASGLSPVDEVGLIETIAGTGDLEVIEALNTAAAGLALTEAGLDDVDVDLLVEIIDDVSGIRTAEDFAGIAQQLALTFAQNEFELDQSKFGITRDDVTAVLFGEGPITEGLTQGDVLNTLLKFERERRAAAQGFGGAQGFVNRQGNLQIAGFSGV